jgi:hypothetical protein
MKLTLGLKLRKARERSSQREIANALAPRKKTRECLTARR